MANHWVMAVGIAFGGIAFQSALAQTRPAQLEPVTEPRDIPPELYREPLVHADVPWEWHGFVRLVTFVRSEDAVPGMGLDLAAQYGLTRSEAAALLQEVRDVMTAVMISAPTTTSICDAEVSSSQDYLTWWARFDEETGRHRQMVVDALESSLEASVWESVMRREFLHWLESGQDVIGDRIDRRKQLEIADYSVWMRGMCGSEWAAVLPGMG